MLKLKREQPPKFQKNKQTDVITSRHSQKKVRIHTCVILKIERIENLYGGIRESALWKQLTAFHKQQNRMSVYQILNALPGLLGSFLYEITIIKRWSHVMDDGCGFSSADWV
jgi:hypothetical protein